jgi:hypothetical protein
LNNWDLALFPSGWPMMPSSAAHAPDPLFTACPPLHRPTEARLHRSRELPTAPLQLMARRTRPHSPPPSGAAIAEPPYSLSLVKPKPSHRCPPFIPFFPRKPTPPEATHRLLSTPPGTLCPILGTTAGHLSPKTQPPPLLVPSTVNAILLGVLLQIN